MILSISSRPNARIVTVRTFRCITVPRAIFAAGSSRLSSPTYNGKDRPALAVEGLAHYVPTKASPHDIPLRNEGRAGPCGRRGRPLGLLPVEDPRRDDSQLVEDAERPPPSASG